MASVSHHEDDGNYGYGDKMSISATMSLVGAVLAHPCLKEHSFKVIDLTEFSMVALMVQQKPSLTRLSLRLCYFKPENLEDHLRYLLMENFLEKLDLQLDIEGRPVDFSGGFGASTSLKELILNFHTQSVPIVTSLTMTEDILHRLRVNQNLECLNVHHFDDENIRLRILRAVSGHPSLQKLLFAFIPGDLNAARALKHAIINTPSLRHLELWGVMDSDDVATLAEELANARCRLQTVDLRNVFLCNAAVAIATALQRNHTLKSLFLPARHSVGDIEATSIANLLRLNDSIEHLEITENDVGRVGTSLIAIALTQNQTLALFEMTCSEKHDATFSARIPQMRGLKHVSLSMPWSNDSLSQTDQDAFLRAIRENTTLEKISSLDYSPVTPEVVKRVDYFVTLNRGRRRILSSPHPVPPPCGHSCWYGLQRTPMSSFSFFEKVTSTFVVLRRTNCKLQSYHYDLYDDEQVISCSLYTFITNCGTGAEQ